MDYSQLGNKRNKRLHNPHTTRVRNKVGLLILRILIALVLISGFAFFGIGMGVYLGILNNAPELDFSKLGPISPKQFGAEFRVQSSDGPQLNLTSLILTEDDEVLTELHSGINRYVVSITEMPEHLLLAFVAIEDERFFEHNGIDPRGIARAIYVTTLPNRGTEGASTITQQLIKNMLEVMDNDFITKLQEQHLALNFERHLVAEFEALEYEDPRHEAKMFILQSYLNMINLGRSNYGVHAAAEFYYEKPVAELDLVQAATIAAITQNPWRFPPDNRPEDNWRRTKLVLRNMRRLGFITDEEYEEAKRERPVLDPITGEQLYDEDGEPRMIGYVYDTVVRKYDGSVRDIMSPFDCFTDALLDQLHEDLMREFNLTPEQANRRIFETGLRIYTTQDLRIQKIVDNAFTNDALWPGAGAGFSVEVTHSMTVYNEITRERRFHSDRRIVDSFEKADEYVEERRANLVREHETIEPDSERIFKLPQPQGAFVIMDQHNGHVVAIRGIRGQKEGNRMFNRATQATRSPGSQMKPLVPFAVLIDAKGQAPSSIIDDIPFVLPNPGGGAAWRPTNHWGGFRGLSTIRNGVYASGNVVSARGAADPTYEHHLGMDLMVRYLELMGISTLSPNDGPAIVLGGLTNGVKLVELAGAYATLANMGEYNRPIFYTRVYDHNDELLLENGNNPQRVFKATSAYMMTSAMMDTVTKGTGTAANWTTGSGLRGQIPIAGKTGTSQRNRDLGFTGYTPYYTAAFWIGNDGEQALHRRTREFHTPMWRTIMEEVHKGLEPRQFIQPVGLVTQSVCRDSGFLLTDLCRNDPRGGRIQHNEIFDMRNVPTQSCSVHQRFTYCTESEMLNTSYCPAESVVTRIGIVRPQPIDHLSGGVSDRAQEFPIGVRQGERCTLHTFGGGTVQSPGDGTGYLPSNEFPVWDMDAGGWVFPNQLNSVAGVSTVADNPPLSADSPLPTSRPVSTPSQPIATPAPTPSPTPIPWQGLGVSSDTPDNSVQSDEPSPFINPFIN